MFSYKIFSYILLTKKINNILIKTSFRKIYYILV